MNELTKNEKKRVIIQLVVGFSFFLILIASDFLPKMIREKKSKEVNIEIISNQGNYALPISSPYKNNYGICYSVEMANWFVSDSIKYNNQLQNLYTYKRLQKISKDFRLIRIYQYLIAGFESTGNICPEAYALCFVAKQNPNIEAVIGTSNNLTWYDSQSNTDKYIRILKNTFGRAIGQVKTLLIGNEINCVEGVNSSKIKRIAGYMKNSLKKYNLKIPVTVTFNNLPVQSGDTLSDNLVGAINSNWDSTWNNNNPFVFIDPYPDAQGINNAQGVFNWQNGVTNYYQSIYPNMQIFIGETGAEGSNNDSTTIAIANDIFTQLDSQYVANNKTVPTFIFEAINEQNKGLNPNQEHMGIYKDTISPGCIIMTLKNGINLPNFK